MLDIRKATEADASFIALLGRITFNESFGHLFEDQNDLLAYHERTFSVSKIKRSLQKTNNFFWIAFVDGLPVGYTKLKLYSHSEFLDQERVCQLQKIYVLKDFLSNKIGHKLQQALLEEATRKGFDTIWLSVLNENSKAIRFYIRNGFKAIGNHDFQIGKENFQFTAMAKTLQ